MSKRMRVRIVLSTLKTMKRKAKRAKVVRTMNMTPKMMTKARRKR